MTTFKATITLAKLTQREPDGNGYARTDTETLADITVTADSAAQAMWQIHEHSTALNNWHAEVADAAVTIERPNDERIEIHVNGEVVATANHDEHGWSGMDAVEKTALAVARAFGAAAEDAR